MKGETWPPPLLILRAFPCHSENATPSEGVLAMDTFLLTSPADRHSHAFGSRKTAYPGSIHLLVGKHNVGETEAMHQQATGVKNQKNSEHFAHYLLTNWIVNLQ